VCARLIDFFFVTTMCVQFIHDTHKYLKQVCPLPLTLTQPCVHLECLFLQAATCTLQAGSFVHPIHRQLWYCHYVCVCLCQRYIYLYVYVIHYSPTYIDNQHIHITYALNPPTSPFVQKLLGNAVTHGEISPFLCIIGHTHRARVCAYIS
jgi:hypothetical protein